MKKYKAIATVILYSGNVKLTADQATCRKHVLKLVKADKVSVSKKEGEKKLVGSGVYEINPGPVCFKAGEEFSYSGEIPKLMLSAVESDTK